MIPPLLIGEIISTVACQNVLAPHPVFPFRVFRVFRGKKISGNNPPPAGQ
jgi:hypothetical protein